MEREVVGEAARVKVEREVPWRGGLGEVVSVETGGG